MKGNSILGDKNCGLHPWKLYTQSETVKQARQLV